MGGFIMIICDVMCSGKKIILMLVRNKYPLFTVQTNSTSQYSTPSAFLHNAIT